MFSTSLSFESSSPANALGASLGRGLVNWTNTTYRNLIYNKNMRVKKALEKYLGSIYPAAEVEIFDFCFCGRANIAVMSDIAFGVECQWSFVSRVV